MSTLPSREIVAEAAAWITRLHSAQRAPDVEAAFRSWLDADRQHAAAFEGMTEIWDTMPAMAMGELSRVAPLPPAARKRPVAILLVRAATIAGVCAALGALAYGLLRGPAYVTDIGEQRIVNLQDGTRVSLNSGTRVSVEYSAAERRIVLKNGEAFFEVARNTKQPFVVVAGDNRITALGTSFTVRYERDSTSVILVEGKIAVSSAFPPTTLIPGQRLTLAKSRPPQLDAPKVDAVTAWRRGEVILDETLLADAIAEMNRYDKTVLVIDDSAIASLPVSGIYRSGDSAGFAAIVARMYGLDVTQDDGRIHLNRQPKRSSY